MADVSGVVRLGENEKGEKVITIVTDDGTEFEYAVSRRAHVGRARRSGSHGRRPSGR